MIDKLQGADINKALLDNLPLPVIVVDRKDLSIIWANKNMCTSLNIQEQEIIRCKLSELLVPVGGVQEGGFLEKLNSASVESIKVYVNTEHPLLRKSVPTTFEQLALQRMASGDHLIAWLIPRNPLLKSFTGNIKDFLLLLDEEGRVRDMTSSFNLFSAFRGRHLIGKGIRDIIRSVDYEEIVRRKSAALDYVKNHAFTAAGEWQTVLADEFRDGRRWINEEGEGAWNFIADKGAEYLLNDYAGYLYLNENINLENKDFIVTLQVEQRNLSRFALLFNQAAPTKWDFTGYNCGLNFVRNRPVLSLKKNSNFRFFRKAEWPEAGTVTLKIEKLGGAISCFVNEKKIAEYFDISPLSNSCNGFGILSTGPNLFTRFEIAARDSLFDESRTFHPFRLRLPQLPTQVFEADFFPIENWSEGEMPIVEETWRFSDVTEVVRVEEDRNLLDRDNRFLRSKDYYGFVGGSAKIVSIIDHVEKVADTDVAISISGPTGSGKAVLARAIHMRSGRSKGPFIKVDCSAIPQGLLESELFGHEKGAFTGAISRHIGKFEAADGGTLFLDEVGNLDMPTQAKLLGFLEDHVFTRVGSHAPMKVDVRIITATNSNLKEMVEQGRFREDLFYRINVVSVELPPLSGRLEDIPILVDHFLKSINAAHKLNIQGIEKPVLETLMTHSWPGNVRELYNILLSMAVVKKEGLLSDRPDFSGSRGGAPARASSYIPENVRHDAIIGLCASRDYFSARDCMSVLPVSLPTIQRDLNKLTKAGKLAVVGKGPSVRYRKK